MWKKLKNFVKPLVYSLLQLFLMYKAALIKRSIKKTGRALRVGFYVVYDASWGARPLFERLIHNQKFEVSVLVCPDVARGEENQNKVLRRTYDSLVSSYGPDYVRLAECRNGSFVDYKDEYDIIAVANPYDEMTAPCYSATFLSRHGKLVIFNDYGYQSGLKFDYMLMASKPYNCFWKFFVDNQEYVQIARKEQYIKGRNVVLSGCCKMDKYSEFEHLPNVTERKTIMISPHHTVKSDDSRMALSNFLRFADFFLRLPSLYPDVLFIFRPHPLLLHSLQDESVWGAAKTDDYMKTLLANQNVRYSTEGVYFQDFAESDALIDDCGSFLAEYFYTGKPQCYILNPNVDIDEDNTAFRKQFLDNVYKAYTEEEILSFIDTVVLSEQDSMKNQRNSFAENIVMVNYPNAAKTIEQYLESFFYVP